MTPVVAWGFIDREAALPPLGAALEARFSALKNPASRAASASAWALLYRTLNRFGVAPGALRFGEHGKPYFEDGGVYFSLTHGGGVCAVSLAAVPTGVDTEPYTRRFNEAMIGRCLSPEEAAAFDGDFLRLWCRKECVVKATGEGLWGYPDAVPAFDPGYVFFETLLRLPEGEQRLTAAFSAAGVIKKGSRLTLLGPKDERTETLT